MIKIFLGAPIQAPALAVWILLDCIFRYSGEMALLDSLLSLESAHVLKVLQTGLTESTLKQVVETMSAEIIANVALRTTFTALFAAHDGRRRYFHKKGPLCRELICDIVQLII